MTQKVLVIDDDVEFSTAVITVLQTKGYAVFSASNGKDGFAKAQEGKVDLILLDVMMTRKTEGFDVARQLKSHPSTSHIPVIIITGIRKEFNLPFGFEADDQWLPVRAVLEKPVKPETLLKTIEDILQQPK